MYGFYADNQGATMEVGVDRFHELPQFPTTTANCQLERRRETTCFIGDGELFLFLTNDGLDNFEFN